MQFNPGNLGIGANPINFNQTLTQPLVPNYQGPSSVNLQAAIGTLPTSAPNTNAALVHAQIQAAQNIANSSPQPQLTQVVADSSTTTFVAIPGTTPMGTNPISASNPPSINISGTNLADTHIDSLPNGQSLELPKPEISVSQRQDAGLIMNAKDLASKSGNATKQATNRTDAIEQSKERLLPIETSTLDEPVSDKLDDFMAASTFPQPTRLENIAGGCQDGVRGFTYLSPDFPSIAPLNFDDAFPDNPPLMPLHVPVPREEFWKDSYNVISSNSETHHRVSNEFLDHVQSNIGRAFTAVEKTAVHQQIRIVRSPSNDYVVTLRNGRLNLSNNYIVISGGPRFNPLTVQFGAMYDFALAPRASTIPEQDSFGIVGELLLRILRPAATIAGRFGTGLAWLLTPSEIGLDNNEFTAQEVDLEIPVFRAHNELPNRLENIPVRIDSNLDRMETPMQPRDKQDDVVSGYNSKPAEMDRGPNITYAYNGSREDGLLFKHKYDDRKGVDRYAQENKVNLAYSGVNVVKSGEINFEVVLKDASRIRIKSKNPSQDLTEAGFQYSKHASRHSRWGEIKSNNIEKNKVAAENIKDIMDVKGDFNVVENESGIKFLEKFHPDGRGIRLQMDGSFKGFLDKLSPSPNPNPNPNPKF